MAQDKENRNISVIKPSKVVDPLEIFIFSFLFGKSESVLYPFCLTQIHYSNKDKIDKCPNCHKELPLQ